MQINPKGKETTIRQVNPNSEQTIIHHMHNQTKSCTRAKPN